MRMCNSVLAVSLAGVVCLAGPARAASAVAQASPASTQVDDKTLQSRIAANLKTNAALAAHALKVDVDKGVVTLNGVVASASEKARAARLATVTGVTAVHNEIVVDASAATKGKADKAVDATKRAAEKTADVTTEAAKKTGEKTKAVAATAGTKTKEAVSASGEAITDSWITTKIKTKFVDEALLEDSDISVTTRDRVVSLTGTVATSAARARAASIARGSEGVTHVVNHLTVKAK